MDIDINSDEFLDIWESNEEILGLHYIGLWDIILLLNN